MELSRGLQPDPSHISDIAGFVELLGRLRVWAGNPSYRVLAKQVGPLLRPPRVLSHTTVADAFQPGRRRLDLDLVVAIVRALRLKESEVDRWRAAWFRVHTEAKAGGPAGVFRQLPADLATFTGRAEQLRLLLNAATSPRGQRPNTAVVAVIEGMAGIGKTRLAVHTAHELVAAGHYAQLQLFVDLHGFDPDLPPADPATVLEAFLRQLEVPLAQIPDALEERAAMFRDRIEGKDALILLDNAADERQVRHLIPASPRCLIMITSRRAMGGLDGAVTVQLDVLDPAESRALLGRIAGDSRADGESAAMVADACGHLPLAVALVGARLRNRPNWAMSDLEAELNAAGLSAMSVGRRSVTDDFDLSLARLDAEQRRIFLMLGLCPGTDVGAEAAAVMAGTDPATAKQLMDSLVDEHMLISPSPGRFALRELLHAYAAGKVSAELPESERWASLRRVLRWYVDRVRDVSVHVPKRADKLLAQVPDLAEGDGTALSTAWSAVGRAHVWREEFNAAEAAYWRAFRLTTNRNGQASALAGMSRALHEQGRSGPAGDAYRRALALVHGGARP